MRAAKYDEVATESRPCAGTAAKIESVGTDSGITYVLKTACARARVWKVAQGGYSGAAAGTWTIAGSFRFRGWDSRQPPVGARRWGARTRGGESVLPGAT